MVFPRYVALLELFGVLVRVVSQFHLALPALYEHFDVVTLSFILLIEGVSMYRDCDPPITLHGRFYFGSFCLVRLKRGIHISTFPMIRCVLNVPHGRRPQPVDPRDTRLPPQSREFIA
jgi:hypothetical protein